MRFCKRNTAGTKSGRSSMPFGMVNVCRSIGLRTRAFFMLGFPEETPAMMEETITFALRLKTRITVQFVPVTAYRGHAARRRARPGPRARRTSFGGGTGCHSGKAYRRFYARPARLIAELAQPRRFLHKLAR
jgi:radical SAM superfamily enzyme YgiQ (UPF0313 family)